MVERNKQLGPDPKMVPYFFDPSDAEQSPETLRRWRKEHLANVLTADTMEKRKWHLSQAVRCDLALIARGILPEIPKAIQSDPTSELVNESGLTEEQAQDLLAKYYEDSVRDQNLLGNPMSESDGLDLYGEVPTETLPKLVEGRAFGATHLKIVSQPTPIPSSKDRRVAYDCGCMYNETQNRWDYHCMLFKSGRCPNVEAQRAREEANKQVVDGNSVTNCPQCLTMGGVVRMEYQASTQWKCPVCGHWENITPDPQRYQAVPLEVGDQPPCGCLWPYKYCHKCRLQYEAWWHRQVDAGLLNEVACPLEVNKPLAQLEASKEAEQETHDPFALTSGMMSTLQAEKLRLAKSDTNS